MEKQRVIDCIDYTLLEPQSSAYADAIAHRHKAISSVLFKYYQD